MALSCVAGNRPKKGHFYHRGIKYPPWHETGAHIEASKRRRQIMSRHLERNERGYEETITDYDGCRWLYDEVCVYDSSEWLADFPLDFCKTCRYFTKERKE